MMIGTIGDDNVIVQSYRSEGLCESHLKPELMLDLSIKMIDTSGAVVLVRDKLDLKEGRS